MLDETIKFLNLSSIICDKNMFAVFSSQRKLALSAASHNASK